MAETKISNKIGSLLLLLMVGQQLFTALAVEAKDAAEKNQEYVLNAQQRDLNNFTIVLSRDAAKVTSETLGFTLVCKAPDWRVVTFNRSQKTICSCRLESFSAPMLTNPLGGRWPSTGFAVHRVHVDVMGHAKLDGQDYSFGVLDDNKKRYEVWQADSMNVAPQCVELLCRLIEIPVIDSVPFFVHPVNHGTPLKKEQLVAAGASLDTTSNSAVPVIVRTFSCKTAPFKSQDFEVPTGYRKVTQMTEVTFSRQMKNNLTDIMNDVGFSSPARER